MPLCEMNAFVGSGDHFWELSQNVPFAGTERFLFGSEERLKNNHAARTHLLVKRVPQSSGWLARFLP